MGPVVMVYCILAGPMINNARLSSVV
jgi:hypothetical protein